MEFFVFFVVVVPADPLHTIVVIVTAHAPVRSGRGWRS